MKVDYKLRDKLEYLNEITACIAGIVEDLDCFEDSDDDDEQYVTVENIERLMKAYYTIACHAEEGCNLADEVLSMIKEKEEAKI